MWSVSIAKMVEQQVNLPDIAVALTPVGLNPDLFPGGRQMFFQLKGNEAREQWQLPPVSVGIFVNFFSH